MSASIVTAIRPHTRPAVESAAKCDSTPVEKLPSTKESTTISIRNSASSGRSVRIGCRAITNAVEKPANTDEREPCSARRVRV